MTIHRAVMYISDSISSIGKAGLLDCGQKIEAGERWFRPRAIHSATHSLYSFFDASLPACCAHSLTGHKANLAICLL
jgi:hypothetical protein